MNTHINIIKNPRPDKSTDGYGRSIKHLYLCKTEKGFLIRKDSWMKREHSVLKHKNKNYDPSKCSSDDDYSYSIHGTQYVYTPIENPYYAKRDWVMYFSFANGRLNVYLQSFSSKKWKTKLTFQNITNDVFSKHINSIDKEQMRILFEEASILVIQCAQERGIYVPRVKSKNAEDHFNKLVQGIAYPVLGSLFETHEELRPISLDSKISAALRKRNLREVSKALVGSAGKAISKLVGEHLTSMLSGAYGAANYLQWLGSMRFGKEDYIYRLLSSPEVFVPSGTRREMQDKDQRKIIRELFLKRYPHRLWDWTTNSDDWHNVRDSIWMIKHIRDAQESFDWPQGVTAKELHEIARLRYRDVQHKPVKLYQDPKLKEIDGKIFMDTYKVIVPENSKQLQDWGDKLHNCIGGYKDAVNSKQTMLFALQHTVTGEITNTLEVRYEGLRQYVASYNEPAGAERWQAMESFLKENKVIES